MRSRRRPSRVLYWGWAEFQRVPSFLHEITGQDIGDKLNSQLGKQIPSWACQCMHALQHDNIYLLTF